MSTAVQYTTNAPAGAELLDEKCPGWASEISLDTLDIDSSQNCVLGQLYGDFSRGAIALFSAAAYSGSQQSGFMCIPDPSRSAPCNAAELNAEWRELIRERL